MDITAALHYLRPGAQWSIPAGCTDATQITWHDDTEPVTQAELDAKLAEPDPAVITAQRAAAFRDEADPLFFKAQRGEASMDEWQAKVAEIRQRYPKPSPSPD